MAACLACGVDAAGSHRAAGAVWLLAGFDPVAPEVTVSGGRHPRPRGVVVHQAALPSVDVTVVEAIPVTSPARTLLDLAAVVAAEAVEEALDDALRRGLVSIPRLRWRADQLGRRPGVALIRRLLDARTDANGQAQSVLETRFMRLLKRARLPTPVCQHQIRDRGRLVAIVDFAYPDLRLAIETDGYRWHSGRIAWQRDLARRNALTRLGWHVIHVTAEDIERRPDATVDVLAQALTPERRPR